VRKEEAYSEIILRHELAHESGFDHNAGKSHERHDLRRGTRGNGAAKQILCGASEERAAQERRTASRHFSRVHDAPLFFR